MDIAETSALITGGASGLGLATAQRLAAAGALVTLLDLPSARGQEAVESIGDTATFAPADVADPEKVGAAVALAADRGPLRIVVNCAGIGDPGRTVGKNGPLPLESFRKVVEVNLIGTFNVIRLAAARMVEVEPSGQERGVIINTASVAAFDGQIGQASYSASKGGIAAMTLPIARDLAGRQIRVVTIAPGMFATPILDGITDDARRSLETQVPHPSRLGAPDEYAALVEHTVANPMLNGEVIRLDGAIRMAPR
ncbi:SDR family NAD(P)-dependent oxidoreductase [Saccharopolyspora mangrovi]|uniref:SDR family NAD(P)-dependent oxidoreductase n=1 Tax=Saccharopolyspora mangrovi TaxID=3082379 RepID=A0ABU6AIF9_9PSEU|nr:SDR family NAD(P)-dependent oxidoreductase [Saccharopolyspora sp. S2-29]MEB3371351.1 SDR family NAD(P)-dependent oxidoreductase [Saccharopolyspora sp. S2-29]